MIKTVVIAIGVLVLEGSGGGGALSGCALEEMGGGVSG